MKQGDVGALADAEVLLFAGTAWFLAKRVRREARHARRSTRPANTRSPTRSPAAPPPAGSSLLGDPLQLAQVTQGVHPGGSGATVLEHILGEDHAPSRSSMGVFLEHTRRMHPDVCRFISDAFYEGRLHSLPECAERRTSDGVGVRWLAVAHEGNRVDPRRRPTRSRREIERLLGHTFMEAVSSARSRSSDVLVVAPYNAQVRLLRQRLATASRSAPSTSSRGARLPSSSTRWHPPAAKTCRGGLDFLLSRTDSTSRCRARSASHTSPARHACWKSIAARSNTSASPTLSAASSSWRTHGDLGSRSERHA